jgi:hypothetical protein
MFEAVAAAGTCMKDATSLTLCLAGVTIPAPLMMHPGKLHAFTVSVEASHGAVQLQEDSLMDPGDRRDILLSQPFIGNSLRLWMVLGHLQREHLES